MTPAALRLLRREYLHVRQLPGGAFIGVTRPGYTNTRIHVNLDAAGYSHAY